MIAPVRLLGFAFANADFLFEIDRDGTILFATGAASDFVRESSETLVGKSAGRLFQPAEGTKFATFAKALAKGDRAGPYRMKLAGGTEAHVAMFRLPQNGANISCTLSKPGGRGSFGGGSDAKTGLANRESFLSAASKMASASDALTLIDVPGLPDLCAGLSPEKADAVLTGIGNSIKNAGAGAVGRISETGFGAIAGATQDINLAKAVRAALSEKGLSAAKVNEACLSLQGPGLSPEQRVLALRYVVEHFAESGKMLAGNGDISGGFAAMMDETQKRLLAMTETVSGGAFELAFQPIRDLKDGKISHYEALARFSNPQGTAPQNTGETIKFVEALGIADMFDLAVANKILALVERDSRKDVHIAFNVSGATIAAPASFAILASLLARKRALAPRILIEITETAAIVDLAAADKAVAALRAMGYRVGLDDFGAGAASLNYLHAFTVDFVKFDGALVKKIGTAKRDDALLAGLVKLCAELGVRAIAECIETEALASQALALGFSQGQGWHLGIPQPEIPDPVVAGLGKRKGVQESWGQFLLLCK
ncbi:MAG TPA: EAL domain-containing protein [Rhizomicrobium sp.]